MNKVCFIFLMSVMFAYTGNCQVRCCNGVDKDCPAFSEAEQGYGQIVSSATDIVTLALSVDGKTSNDITGLMRGVVGNRYLDEVEYVKGTQLTYTIKYAYNYYPPQIAVEGRGASDIKVEMIHLGNYNISFTVTGAGYVKVKVISGYGEFIAIRIGTL